MKFMNINTVKNLKIVSLLIIIVSITIFSISYITQQSDINYLTNLDYKSNGYRVIINTDRIKKYFALKSVPDISKSDMLKIVKSDISERRINLALILLIPIVFSIIIIIFANSRKKYILSLLEFKIGATNKENNKIITNLINEKKILKNENKLIYRFHIENNIYINSELQLNYIDLYLNKIMLDIKDITDEQFKFILDLYFSKYNFNQEEKLPFLCNEEYQNIEIKKNGSNLIILYSANEKLRKKIVIEENNQKISDI